jgi:hypothetical protein
MLEPANARFKLTTQMRLRKTAVIFFMVLSPLEIAASRSVVVMRGVRDSIAVLRTSVVDKLSRNSDKGL